MEGIPKQKKVGTRLVRSNSRGNRQQEEDADTCEDQKREERGFSGTEALEPRNTKKRSYATPKRDSAGWIRFLIENVQDLHPINDTEPRRLLRSAPEVQR
eukprot:TRINITY_DN86980_c0_g1_i1.p1 TRINITY_DN86980_c0_g1~~TRINITY_DN86980_c0_g1_i1.p1  ORF type:complete len:100 (-),score=21.62 TRINITY_DN86980_c0_g1_i1:19-318(-)